MTVHCVRVLATAFAAVVMSATAAAPQGVLDSLLNPFKRPAELPAPANAPPLDLSARAAEKPPATGVSGPSIAAGANGPWTAYCVRLCDGRYFPLQRSFAMSPTEQCRALCPAAKTKVLGGGGIANASAADGTRYANLENAFLYRKRVVGNCTCNGRDAFGLARVDLANDPTLRAGDIVAVNGGFAVVTGARQGSELTPIERYSGVSGEMRRKLAQTKVMPTPQTARTSPATDAESGAPTKRTRRAQLWR